MFRVVFTLPLLLATAATANPETCRTLRDGLPTSLVTLRFEGTTDHEADRPGLGYSSSYVTSGAKLSADVFDFRKTGIDEGFAKEVFDAAVVAVALKADEHGATYELDDVFKDTDPDFFVDFVAFGHDSLDVAQFVAVGRADGCIVKLRFSGPSGNGSKNVFLAALRAVNAHLRE